MMIEGGLQCGKVRSSVVLTDLKDGVINILPHGGCFPQGVVYEDQKAQGPHHGPLEDP